MEAIEGTIVDPDEDEIYDVRSWRREAEIKPFRFHIDEELFTAKSPEEFDWQEQSRNAARSQDGDMRPFIQMMLGDEQYERFCKHEVLNGELGGIAEAWQQFYGLSVPESRASRRSSANASSARPSKRTSKRRTK